MASIRALLSPKPSFTPTLSSRPSHFLKPPSRTQPALAFTFALALPVRLQSTSPPHTPAQAIEHDDPMNKILRMDSRHRQTGSGFHGGRGAGGGGGGDGGDGTAAPLSPRERQQLARRETTVAPDGAAKATERLLQEQTDAAVRQRVGRDWVRGDVYGPHDLTSSQQRLWLTGKQKRATKRDVFDELGVDPLKYYKNFAVLSEFVTNSGSILPRKMTGLRPVNQRKIAKAIRRAVGLGLIPSSHRHPQMISQRVGIAAPGMQI